ERQQERPNPPGLPSPGRRRVGFLEKVAGNGALRASPDTPRVPGGAGATCRTQGGDGGGGLRRQGDTKPSEVSRYLYVYVHLNCVSDRLSWEERKPRAHGEPQELRRVGPISSPAAQLQLLWLIAPGEMKTKAREEHDLKGKAALDDQGLPGHLSLQISCRQLDVVPPSGYTEANDRRSGSKEVEMRNTLISKDLLDMTLPCHAVSEHHAPTPPRPR
ncbi:unnamed protein product, partial [Gadus morhua 'NCC']